MRGSSALAALVALAIPATCAADSTPQWRAPVAAGQVPMSGGGFLSQIVAADFTGDGHQDLLLTRSVYLGQQTFPVVVLAGNGHGKFDDATAATFASAIPAVQNARELVVADFNGDRRPDVFVADHGDDRDPWPGYQNTLILSAPGGKLVDATANLPQVYDFSHSATTGDVNGDGATDIYVGNIYGANRVPPRILLGDGSGGFALAGELLPAAQTDLDKNKYTSDLFADLNGDGSQDLVLGGDDLPTPSTVLLNDGTGHLHEVPGAMPPKPFGPDAIALDIAPLDVNGDGKLDLLVAFTKGNPFYVGRWIQVLIGNGDGTFSDETATRLPQSDNSDAWPMFFELRDLNRDGLTDFGVRVAGGAGGAPLVYLLGPDGVFRPGPAVNGRGLWTFIDAEGDGSNDIATVNPGSGAVSLLEEGAQPPPTSDFAAPVLGALKMKPKRFRAGAGTTISYTVSHPSTTVFRVERQSRHGLFRFLRGSFTFSNGAPGRVTVPFDGRLRGRRLAPGVYRLNARPRSPHGVMGDTVRARFIIGRR